MRGEIERERERRRVYEERRRANLSPTERFQEELWIRLYGDRRLEDDPGDIGRIMDRLERLERRLTWAGSTAVAALLVLVMDLIVRLTK